MNETQVIVGSVIMVLLGLYGLAAVWLANLWFGLVFGVMHIAGNAWWIVKVTTDDYGLGECLFTSFTSHNDQLSCVTTDKLFEVPLVYAVLISGVTVLYLYDLHYTQFGDKIDSSSFLKKVNSRAKLVAPAPKYVPRPSLTRIAASNASPKSGDNGKSMHKL